MVEVEPNRTLTRRQMYFLQMICRLKYMTGHDPTYRELMAAMNFASPTAVYCYTKALEKKGWLKINEIGGARNNWQLIRDPDGWTSLPGGGICPDEDLPELIAQLQTKLETAHG